MRGAEDSVKIFATEQAIERLKKDIAKRGPYRITVVGYGWGGPQFGLVPGEPQDDDYMEDFSGIQIFAEKLLIDKFEGFKVDYSNFFLTRGYYVMAMRYGSKC